MRPILVVNLQRLTHEQRAETGAVDEQVAFDLAAVVEPNRRDLAVRSVRLDLDDLAFDAPDAERFAELAQVFRVQTRVDVERVVHAAARQVREAVLLRGTQLKAVLAIVAGEPAL